MTDNILYNELLNRIDALKPRSVWDKGVRDIAYTMVEDLHNGGVGFTEFDDKAIEKWLLNGAENWKEYSYGGNMYIYDEDIAKALCTPSELKRCTHKDGSLYNPNGMYWLNVQASACRQAFLLIKSIIKGGK